MKNMRSCDDFNTCSREIGGKRGLAPGGWADARGAASIVQFFPVGLSLPSPPFILNGGLVV